MIALLLTANTLLYSLRLTTSTGSFPKPLSQEEEQYYLECSAQGDIEARNILVERNLRLVAHILKKYYASASDQDDLISIGTIGLIKAISTFDSSKGIRLATYAGRCIQNEILMYFRAMRKSAGDVSLSDMIETGKDGGLSIMDVLASDEDMFEEANTRSETRRLLSLLGDTLSPREQQVISWRYGLYTDKPMPQREVAEKLGISRSYVSRIEKKALEKLKAAMEGSNGV
jgi:RNA polymerase sporulation-specific sigma factor